MKIRTLANEQAAVSWTLATLSAAALACLCTPEAHAQESTRIVAATVFPDSASVERELRVPGGTRHITLACVPAAVDVSTLQVDGDSAARMGDVRATPVPESRIEDCAPPVAKARRDALALQRASLESQQGADELAFNFLQAWASGGRADADAPASAPSRGGASVGVTRPGATAAELRKSALELLADQARVKRELAALMREETRVNDDQPVSKGKTGWRTVRFDVWSPAAATLRVRYNVTGTYWRPTYRASLDTGHTTLRIDRQAEIVQASGEDWGDVRVRLSTRQPQRNAQADTPTPWWLDLVAAVAKLAGYDMAAAPAAPMVVAESRVVAGVPPPPTPDAVEPPPWATETTQGDTVTEFAIAQPVALPSDGETHTLQIGSQSLPVTLKRRTTPRTNPGVYILATANRPTGVWPAGPLQAYQDGTLVGRSEWRPADGEKFEIAMGQDDLMHVDIESPGSFTQSKGVFNGSVERRSKAVYAIVNQHPTAVTVEMLDAAPVSRNGSITVTHTYDPAPATTEWNEIPGVAAWTLAIPAQKTQRVSVTHAIVAPKDAQIANLP